MTTKEQRILRSHLNKISKSLGNIQMMNLEPAFLELYEENSDAENLDELMADLMLGSQMIQIQDEHLQAYYAMWEAALTDIQAA